MMKTICGKKFKIVYSREEKATERGDQSCFDVREDDELAFMVLIDEMSPKNPNNSFNDNNGKREMRSNKDSWSYENDRLRGNI